MIDLYLSLLGRIGFAGAPFDCIYKFNNTGLIFVLKIILLSVCAYAHAEYVL